MFKLGTTLNIMSKKPYDTNKFAMHKAQKMMLFYAKEISDFNKFKIYFNI